MPAGKGTEYLRSCGTLAQFTSKPSGTSRFDSRSPNRSRSLAGVNLDLVETRP
jgi:hypothetical protein